MTIISIFPLHLERTLHSVLPSRFNLQNYRCSLAVLLLLSAFVMWLLCLCALRHFVAVSINIKHLKYTSYFHLCACSSCKIIRSGEIKGESFRKTSSSLLIVKEGHWKPRECSGESTEPWTCACLLSD